MDPYVSINILTHNAPEYIRITIKSLRAHTKGCAYFVNVLDNASDDATKALLLTLKEKQLIDRLEFSSINTFFASGNNLLAKNSPENATHYLLLNSDVAIQDDDWLTNLLRVHTRGVTSYGAVLSPPIRADGYCFLIDADLYNLFGGLDENYQWWWAITKLQAALLEKGHDIKAYVDHEKYLHHYGGKSGSSYKAAKGLDTSMEKVLSWFKQGSVQLL